MFAFKNVQVDLCLTLTFAMGLPLSWTTKDVWMHDVFPSEKSTYTSAITEHTSGVNVPLTLVFGRFIAVLDYRSARRPVGYSSQYCCISSIAVGTIATEQVDKRGVWFWRMSIN
ncbi:MAG: hypothetical protein ABF868_06145 [Sporolactobacillus sp.]